MKKVLLVDDEQSSSEIIRFFIRKNELPLEVVGEAVNGRDAVSKIRKSHPDIVFLDIEMPVLNGLQVMEAVRNDRSCKTDFVIITAYDRFSYAQQALRLGARDFLLKPVMYDQFCETMKRVLGYGYYDNPQFNRLIAWIDEHYMDEVGCSECAEMFGMSTSNIARLCQKYLSMSFTEYLNSVRIRKAVEIIDNGGAIKEAAMLTGYHNLNYFYRTFKKRMGMTPGEYLQNQAGEEKSGITEKGAFLY